MPHIADAVVIPIAILMNRDSFPRPAPFHGLKDNQRGHSIQVARFNARHGGA